MGFVFDFLFGLCMLILVCLQWVIVCGFSFGFGGLLSVCFVLLGLPVCFGSVFFLIWLFSLLFWVLCSVCFVYVFHWFYFGVLHFLVTWFYGLWADLCLR